MRQIVAFIFAIFAVVTLIAIAFTFNSVNQESSRLEGDLEYRSSLLADSLKESVEPNFNNGYKSYLRTLVEKYVNDQRIAGIAVLDSTGKVVAASATIPSGVIQQEQTATNAMDSDSATGDFLTINGKNMYVFASPLHKSKSVVGALLIVQNAAYIDSQLFDIWTGNVVRIIVQVLLISFAVLFIFRWLIYSPIQSLVESLQKTRLNTKEKNEKEDMSEDTLLQPLVREVSHIRRSLMHAQLAASEEARASLERINSPWTAKRLEEFVKDSAKGRPLYVISNREPYIHTKNNGNIIYSLPVSGMASALEPVMQATGGTWIAYGSGDADRLVVDRHNSVSVPPDDPKYTLKRVWLTREEVNGYYNGFSNEGLWPLCHRAHNRPIFRKEDWEQYQKVNKKFADATLVHMKGEKHPIVFVQDFHLALVPRLIKNERPDATIGIFWHIPWPSSESFSICPWAKEILDGILGADIIGFHTQLHCNNFIDTVGHELESLIDLERFSVTRNNHLSLVKPFPISTEFPSEDTNLSEEEKGKLLKRFDIKTSFVGLGVDRLEYTKGILERLKGIEIFLLTNPDYIGKFTFLQIAVPSRTEVKRYQDFRVEVERETERINTQFKKNGWKPIVLSLKQYTHEELNQLYKLTNVCLVTSLDDGMNLVAKEFVAARSDEKGVLILSEFTGASKELTSALLVNPYNGEQTATTIKTALEMSNGEQTRRMRTMREQVKSRNVYLWSAEIIKALITLG